MIWEVFRQEKKGDYHKHCGNVHAPDREMALMFAEIQHARRMHANSLWVVPQAEIAEVDAEEASFGGTTDKAFRWAMTYNDIDASFAQEVADSEKEQEKAAKTREAQI
ncbi:1,2-phenylacetyl-CoA epoxidase subunit PaaB [Natronocalculus amylovorans]|uniref:Phenylacetic acid degradation protein PaaB n=1 Tax=Natronocalculus amylovorans TaxID=2917812 RepID=A0AAE3FXF5_9EURY|nr:1,2-phenylacetyl-CoA epoxidase subunit PaaB [Natronocalculus amylovorans]MCL9817104.1 phenylacetic acid degradation protein PaaB [Natronocalculus amylovorans]NUE02869.1 phenylacetic acid degradation protein PaaB [Halorubraceae archaeon YAN]